MLSMHTRRNISLILLIGLLVVTGVVWSMGVGRGTRMEYTSVTQGFAGDVGVDVTISGGKIADAVRPHEETPIADPAIETLVKNISRPRIPVDVVWGHLHQQGGYRS